MVVKKKVKAEKKLKCQYCGTKVAHMVVTLTPDGDIHVHAPFDNKYVMNEFLSAILKEQKIFNKEQK